MADLGLYLDTVSIWIAFPGASLYILLPLVVIKAREMQQNKSITWGSWDLLALCVCVWGLTAAQCSTCVAGSWTALEGWAGCAGRQTVPDTPDRRGERGREKCTLSYSGPNICPTCSPDYPAWQEGSLFRQMKDGWRQRRGGREEKRDWERKTESPSVSPQIKQMDRLIRLLL